MAQRQAPVDLDQRIAEARRALIIAQQELEIIEDVLVDSRATGERLRAALDHLRAVLS